MSAIAATALSTMPGALARICTVASDVTGTTRVTGCMCGAS
jgi:hypothetical protein